MPCQKKRGIRKSNENGGEFGSRKRWSLSHLILYRFWHQHECFCRHIGLEHHQMNSLPFLLWMMSSPTLREKAKTSYKRRDETVHAHLLVKDVFDTKTQKYKFYILNLKNTSNILGRVAIYLQLFHASCMHVECVTLNLSCINIILNLCTMPFSSMDSWSMRKRATNLPLYVGCLDFSKCCGHA